MKNSKACTILNVLLLIFGLLLALGTVHLFHACGQTEEGSWMSCHWAQQSAAAVGGLLAVLSVLLFLVKEPAGKAAVSLCMVPAAVLAMLFPGILINLCMMADMRCRAVMRPCVLLIGGVILILAVLSALLNRKGSAR